MINGIICGLGEHQPQAANKDGTGVSFCQAAPSFQFRHPQKLVSVPQIIRPAKVTPKPYRPAPREFLNSFGVSKVNPPQPRRPTPDLEISNDILLIALDRGPESLIKPETPNRQDAYRSWS